MSEHIFILDSNSHGNVGGVVPRTAPRAPMVKAPDFEKPLRGDNVMCDMGAYLFFSVLGFYIIFVDFFERILHFFEILK